MDVRDKVALVTGASRGIGRSIALALAEAGADVVCAARSTEGSPSKLPGTIEDTAREAEARGRRALTIRANVARDDQVEAMARRTLQEFGRLDILVNNAGISAPGRFLDLPVKHWDLVMNVNLRGAYLCIRAFLPTMMSKVTALAERVRSGGLPVDIQVDGGINKETVGIAAKAGANAFVSGTGVFGSGDVGEAVHALRAEAERASEAAVAP